MADPTCFPPDLTVQPGRTVLRGAECSLDGYVVTSGGREVRLVPGGRGDAYSTELGTLTVVSASEHEAVIDVVVEGTPGPSYDQVVHLAPPPALPFDRPGQPDGTGAGWLVALAILGGLGLALVRVLRSRA